MTGLRITGGKELSRRLKSLDFDMRKRIGRAAVRDGAKVVRQAVEDEAPPRTTAPIHIKDEVKVQVATKESTEFSWVYYVRISSKAFYWYFLEFGTSRIEDAKPFFRPAFEKSKAAALSAMIATLSRRLKR